MPIRPEKRSWYPDDWNKRSVFVRFVRADFRCEWCGAVHGVGHPLTGSRVVLTTAHIYDDIDRPHSLLNLVALCQKCHNSYDGKKRAQNRKERLRNKQQQELFN